MNLAPIIVFSYNRPEHLRRTLEALAGNDLACESVLYIYCDGAKANATPEQVTKVMANREVAHAAAGFREVHVVEREHNLGLADNIIGGVTEVIHQYGRVIVVEDDLLTSRYFLHYMNSALDYYEHRPGVMSISANRPPVDKMRIPDDYEYDVFVSLRSYSTGWATWQDRWDRVDWSLDYLPHLLSHPEEWKAFNRAGDDMTDMLCLQRDHKIDSWAIRFCFAHFHEHCVAILPCIPYVDNIGFDGTGIHSGTDETDYRNNVGNAPANPRFVDNIYEDKRVINAFASYYSHKKRPLWQKGYYWLLRKLGHNPIEIFKTKVYL